MTFTRTDASRISLYALEHAIRIIMSFFLLVGMNGDNFSFMQELGIVAYITIWYSLLAPIAVQVQIFIKEKRIIPLSEYFMHAGVTLTKGFVFHLGITMVIYAASGVIAPQYTNWIESALFLPIFASVMGEMAGFAFVMLPAGIASKGRRR